MRSSIHFTPGNPSWNLLSFSPNFAVKLFSTAHEKDTISLGWHFCVPAPSESLGPLLETHNWNVLWGHKNPTPQRREIASCEIQWQISRVPQEQQNQAGPFVCLLTATSALLELKQGAAGAPLPTATKSWGYSPLTWVSPALVSSLLVPSHLSRARPLAAQTAKFFKR